MRLPVKKTVLMAFCFISALYICQTPSNSLSALLGAAMVGCFYALRFDLGEPGKMAFEPMFRIKERAGARWKQLRKAVEI